MDVSVDPLRAVHAVFAACVRCVCSLRVFAGAVRSPVIASCSDGLIWQGADVRVVG